MAVKYFSSWEIYTKTFAGAFQEALTNNQFGAAATVWRGPSGDAVVSDEGWIGEGWINDEYADYIEDGIVEDYLSDED